MKKYMSFSLLPIFLILINCSVKRQTPLNQGKTNKEMGIIVTSTYGKACDSSCRNAIAQDFQKEISNPSILISKFRLYPYISISVSPLESKDLAKLELIEQDLIKLLVYESDTTKCPEIKSTLASTGQNFAKSSLSIEALRFLNGVYLGYYPCPIEYDWASIKLKLNL